MTDSTAAATAAPAKTSFWEDLIDIYFNPTAVFRRREGTSVWPPMLFVAIAIGLITYATFNTLEPIFDAEFARGAGKAMAKNPQITPELMNKMRDYTNASARYGIGVIMMVWLFLAGAVSWLIGKMFTSKQSFHAALVVAAWAEMPRVIGSVLGGVQGLLLDPAKLTGQMSITLSPARFMDPDATNPLLLQVLGRLDLITIWVTVLFGIGFYVTGKTTKGKAAAFAVVMWVVGALPALRQAYTTM